MQGLHTFTEIVDQLASTNSSKEKQAILKEFDGAKECQKLVQVVLNDFVRFNVTKKSILHFEDNQVISLGKPEPEKALPFVCSKVTLRSFPLSDQSCKN